MRTEIQVLQEKWRDIHEQGFVQDRKFFRGIDDVFREADQRVRSSQFWYDRGLGTPNQALRVIRDEIIDQKGILIEPDRAYTLVDELDSLIKRHPEWEMGPNEWQHGGEQDNESARKLEDAFHGMLVFNPNIARRIGASPPSDGCKSKAILLLMLTLATASGTIISVLRV